jgi:hypothetical protein
MRQSIFILLLFISCTVFSQQRAIEITNIKSGKVKFLEENQRVKIRTLAGNKYVGNLKFSDSLTLNINNQYIKIDSLKSIKKQPKVIATLKTAVLVLGLSVVGSSLIVASGGGNSAFLLLTVGTGTTISAGLIESINANNSDNKWSFKIIKK